MADAVRASCAAPVFKRPRLEFSACESEALISYESVSSEERFSIDSGLQEDVYEGTSSNDCPMMEGSVNFCSDPPSAGVHNTVDVPDVGGMFQQKDGADNFSHGPPSSMLAHELPQGEKDEDQDSNISESAWVEQQRSCGMDPRVLLAEIFPEGAPIPTNVNEGLLWRYILSMLHEPRRPKLPAVNTLDDAVALLRRCSRVIVLTGAGVSVSCGIPDFRSRNGIYARLSKDYPDLPDPQAMFDINYFRKDPRPFFKFAKEIYPGQFQPSPSHRFIRLLEKEGKLLRNYTQNIDTLEHAAGIRNVITCHGSFATATCTICRYKVDSSVIKEDIFNQTIPYCPMCGGEGGIMKPDIVFFGEGLSDEFHECKNQDKQACDLLIVVGSSLKVRPVAMIPSCIPTHVPQILINREPLNHLTFDIELLGDCDVILGELARRLKSEWTIEEDIVGAPLREIRIPPASSKQPDPAPDLAALEPSAGPEINNNLQHPSEPSLSQGGDESNSCDYASLSAIRLEDSSEDGSCTHPEDTTTQQFPPEGASVHELVKKMPGDSYLFLPPNRYVFHGAEMDDEDDSCSTSTDYSSSDEPPLNPQEEECAPSEGPLEKEQSFQEVLEKALMGPERSGDKNLSGREDCFSRWQAAAEDSCSSSDCSRSPRRQEEANKCSPLPEHSPLREAPKESPDT
ncbi:hypothetical protein JTE90_005217 [Oedothorax gibbosus]|uniref:protein acetyllysine N-acetyltransferase n=1 Tax=Oedothorax gibbosus TaxID=931172 RepID=A0AAV6ULP1_9ARAC|nr:hypothetical protein JTE90_005217 [Oedothorax gibbosus]